MTDIVERLRGPAPLHWEAKEAADEITALRAEVERLKVEAAAQYADGAHDGSDRAQDLWAGEITALRAEVERLKIENIQMQAALGYGILAEDERHILPSNPFKCGTCDASKHLRAENERLKKRVEWHEHALHTCHAECDKPLCKATRENERLTAEIASLTEEFRIQNNDLGKALLENERLRAYALKAFTVVEFCCGEGLLLETPFYDCDDLLLEGVNLLNVETAEEARTALEEK